MHIEKLTEMVSQASSYNADNKKTLGEVSARLHAAEQTLAAMDGHTVPQGAVTGGNFGQALNTIQDNDGFRLFASGQTTSGPISMGMDIKAALTNTGRGGVDDTSYPVAPTRGDIVLPPVNLTLVDVLQALPIETSTFEFVRLDGYGSADYQAKEGEEKSKTGLEFTLERAETQTIAHHQTASKQILDDAKQLANTLEIALRAGCNKKLEQELLNGAGGEGKIKGLVTQATEYPADPAASPADKIGAAATDLAAEGFNATHIIMHPLAWYAITSAKASVGDGQYLMGSPRDPVPASLYGVPVITSPAIAGDKALVIDSNYVRLLVRQAPTVEFSRHTGSNFTRNLVTVLAELRAGLAVLAPSATRLVTLTGEG